MPDRSRTGDGPPGGRLLNCAGVIPVKFQVCEAADKGNISSTATPIAHETNRLGIVVLLREFKFRLINYLCVSVSVARRAQLPPVPDELIVEHAQNSRQPPWLVVRES